MSLLSDAKIRLRVTSTAYDGEISDLIATAMSEMQIVGITPDAVSGESPLVKEAILTYAKANFGWNNPDRDKLMRSYESMRDLLSLSAEYNSFEVTFAVVNSLGAAIRRAYVTFNGETLLTGAAGTVVFYVKPGNNYTYAISADGYTADDDDLNLVDVIDTAVSVSIVLGV